MMVNSLYRDNHPEIYRNKGDIPLWLIAKKIGIHENTLRNWMRSNLSGVRKAKILNAIEEIKKEMVH